MKITPFKLKGEVYAPPSKSMAHRNLICGAFSKKSVIKNVAFSKDILSTLDALKALGTQVEISGDTVILGGFGEGETVPEFCCRESGSTLRFMLPICATLGQKIKLTGTSRLFSRDLSAFEDFSKRYDIFFEKGEDYAYVCGSIDSGEYEIDASLSSQFVSGLLFALARVGGESVIKLLNKVESRPYIDLTVKSLCDFGVKACFENESTVKIHSTEFKSREVFVEGDYSNAAFLDAFNFVGNDIKVLGLSSDSLQGDKIYREYFSLLGKEPLNLSDCPDLAPVLFALSCVVGECEFVGTKRLKIKESDRAEAMKEELEKFGVKVDVFENRVVVWGGKIHAPTAVLDSHNDHRIVMALTVLLSLVGGEIDGESAVEKSYPDFFKVIEKLKDKQNG